MFGLDAGALEPKRAAFGSIFKKKWGSKQATLRRWVNQYISQQFKTSRRLNVATPQRRDVNSRSAPHHLKYGWLRNQGKEEIERRTNKGTEFQSIVTQISKEFPGFVLFLIFVGY